MGSEGGRAGAGVTWMEGGGEGAGGEERSLL